MKVVAAHPAKSSSAANMRCWSARRRSRLRSNRRVRCTIDDSGRDGWNFTTHGFAPDAVHTRDALLNGPLLARTDPAYLCQHVLRQMQSRWASPDSSPGASAHRHRFARRIRWRHENSASVPAPPVCAALTGALLATHRAQPLDVFPIALAAHRLAQGGRGSGSTSPRPAKAGSIRYEAPSRRASPRVAFPPASRTRRSGPAPAPIHANISRSSTPGAAARHPDAELARS